MNHNIPKTIARSSLVYKNKLLGEIVQTEEYYYFDPRTNILSISELQHACMVLYKVIKESK